MNLPRREWVNGEYINELAVLMTWIAVALPWVVTYTSLPSVQTKIVYLRWPLFQVSYTYSPIIENTARLMNPYSAFLYQQGQTMQYGYIVWIVMAVIMAAAFALSIAMYLREGKVEETLPVQPARVLGAMLFVSGVVGCIALTLLVTMGIPATPIPVGVVLYLIFGGVLLTQTLPSTASDASMSESIAD